MSKTYFLGLEVSRSGVLKVSFSSQKACHFGSTSAKGYAVVGEDDGDEDAASWDSSVAVVEDENSRVAGVTLLAEFRLYGRRKAVTAILLEGATKALTVR